MKTEKNRETFERGGWHYFKDTGDALKIGRIDREEFLSVCSVGLLMGSAMLTEEHKDTDFLMPPGFKVSESWGEGNREADYDGSGFSSYKAFLGDANEIINIIIPSDPLEYLSWEYAIRVVQQLVNQARGEKETGRQKAVQAMITSKSCRIAVYESLRLAFKCQYNFFDFVPVVKMEGNKGE
ncbi:MAG: hypothetical protein M0P69_10215 [Bacteroidales bacterium]|nr:hypothetical protein [Bacteroidales bacterium]